MKITCHFQPESPEDDKWVRDFSQLLPGVEVTRWVPGEAPADYAVVWCPSRQFVTEQTRLKALFNAGAGVDAFLKLGLHINCPLIRLEDAGMAEQMCEYISQGVLTHFRDFDLYAVKQRNALWEREEPRKKADFPIGILGLGVLGQKVASDMRARGFPVHAWTRSQRDAPAGIPLFHGAHGLDQFLAATQILICLLPLTHETEGILNAQNLHKLRHEAYVINVARGAHVIDDDLIAAIDDGHIAGALLDVFREEPLSPTHPFWHHRAIRVTPHISAATLRSESVKQIVAKINRIEAGLSVSGVVDIQLGY